MEIRIELTLNSSTVRRVMKLPVTLEWLLLGGLAVTAIIQWPAEESGQMDGRQNGGSRSSSQPGESALPHADAAKPLSAAASNARRVNSTPAPPGLKLDFQRFKEGWRFSLGALYADRRAHGLGPGPGLPMDLAPDLGLTGAELRTFNDCVVAAVDRMKAHERTIAQMTSNADGDFWSIPAYVAERESIMTALRQEVTSALKEKSRAVLDIIEASPYLSAGESGTTVSAVIHDGITGVEFSQGTHEIAGPYSSDAGEFILSRYGHLINFTAIDRASQK